MEEIGLKRFSVLPTCLRGKGRSKSRTKGRRCRRRDHPGMAQRVPATLENDGMARERTLRNREGIIVNRDGTTVLLGEKGKPPIRHHLSERRQSPSMKARKRMQARVETTTSPIQMTWPSFEHCTTVHHCPACSITTWRKVCNAIQWYATTVACSCRMNCSSPRVQSSGPTMRVGSSTMRLY